MPFPRDWLGPRDELVPFGRDAAEKPDADADAQAADVHEISLTPPPGPDAFWGEDSAEIHAVLQGPDVGPRDEAPTPGTRRGPSRAVALIAAGVVALVAAGAVVIVGLVGKSSPPHEVIANPVMGSPSAEQARLASLQKSLAVTAASSSHRPRKAAKHVAARHSRHRPAPKPARHVDAVHTSSPAYPVTTQPVASSSSSVSTGPSTPVSSPNPSQPVDVPSSSSSGSVVSEPSQPTSSSTTSGGGATSSSSGGQSSKAKAPAGPTGNSALLGPGHCNC